MSYEINGIHSDSLVQDKANHINVMIVDDDALIRDGLNSLLSNNSQIKVCAQASSGEEALELASIHQPDVVLMDIHMPGYGGIEATKRILLAHPNTKVLALSAYNDESHPSEIIHVGARGYLTKGVNFKEMCDAIQKVNSGETYVCSAVSDKIRSHLNLGRDLVFDNLTTTETEICKELIYGQPIKSIAEKMGMSESEIIKVKQDIFNRLHIENDIALMHLAIRNGLLDQK